MDVNSLQLVTYPSDILTQRADAIAGFGAQWIEDTAVRMMDLMIAHKGIGLAAPQVGLPIRMIVIKVDAPRVMINPVIEEASEKQTVYPEGCLSFPGGQVNVWRPAEVKVSYRNLKGERICDIFDGLEGRCIQHEIDHLDGICLIDRIDNPKRKRKFVRGLRL